MGTKNPKTADWHPEDVKAAIRKTGVSLSALGVQHGKSVSAIRMALFRPSAPVQCLIAAHLGLHPTEIWPNRYDELGQPLDRRRSDQRRNNYRDRGSDSQKQEAA